jgi:hypothetical protein
MSDEAGDQRMDVDGRYDPVRKALTPMDKDESDTLLAARDMLAALWVRAMNNDATLQEIKAIRSGCVAIAIAKYGVDRAGLFAGWRNP